MLRKQRPASVEEAAANIGGEGRGRRLGERG
jgi:hypothetical protein